MNASNTFDTGTVCRNTESIFHKECSIDVNISNVFTEDTLINPFQNSTVAQFVSNQANQNTFNADFRTVSEAIPQNRLTQASVVPVKRPTLMGYSATGAPLNADRKLFSTPSYESRF